MSHPHQNRDIAELLALAQATSALQQPQAQAQQAGDQRHAELMHMALQLLGIQQSGQEADANRALTAQHYQQLFGQQQQEHQDRVTAEADRSGQFWGGELPAKYAGQGIEAQNAQLTRDELARHHGAIESGQTADRATANTGNVIHGLGLLDNPNVNPNVIETLRHMPGFEPLGSAMDASKANAHSAMVSKLIAAMGATKDPTVRETVGRTTAGADTGAYDEAIGQLGASGQIKPQPTPGMFSPGSTGQRVLQDVGQVAGMGLQDMTHGSLGQLSFLKKLQQLLSQPTQ